MNIRIDNLTPRQIALCDIMWAIESREGVESFISTLPPRDQRECRVLIELMQWAFLDEVESTEDAQEIIEKISQY